MHAFLGDEYSFILGYHGGTHASTHGILNYYTVGFGTEDNAYGICPNGIWTICADAACTNISVSVLGAIDDVSICPDVDWTNSELK